MLLDADFLKRLEETEARTEPGGRRRRSERLWKPLRKKEGRPRSRLERFLGRLLQGDGGPIVFLIDSTQSMTFTDSTPPTRSDKFSFARRFVAATGYAALRRGIGIRVMGFCAARGRRSPVVPPDRPEAFLEYLEGLRPGGNNGFGYKLRNELLRYGPAAYFVILSDFRDVHWADGIPALVSGAARVALVQVVDPKEQESEQAPPEPSENIDLLVGPGADWTTIGIPAEAINARLVSMAHEHRLELVALLLDAPIEETILTVLRRP
jgi:uncharacterized protein (DUF58 family)